MSAIRAMVTIAGHELPEPSAYSATTSDKVEAGTNVQGVTIGAVIREDVAKIDIGWKFLTARQWAEILQLFKTSAGGSFYNEVTFFDQTINDWSTRTMYVSDRSAPVWRRDETSGLVSGYTDCSLSLTEK